ncbi:MAG: ABC transporter ATP-binding protein [Planctomycetes bacterium]|nr:ABC transporter ATP-binding protein [Planctomycetota bacterium]
MSGGTLLLEAADLRKEFGAAAGATARALDGVSLRIHRGEAGAILGESGGGKSTLALVLARLLDPDSGSLVLHGPEGGAVDLRRLEGGALRRARRSIQLIFQDPGRALDPRQRVGDAIAEAYGAGAPRGVGALLERLGLDASIAERYPRELSGGEKQRICVARALAAEPELLILDEATASLDAGTRRLVLDVLRERQRAGCAILMITHEIGLARWFCSRAAVLYLGRIVEELPTSALRTGAALHPYTQALLAADDDRSEAPRTGSQRTAPADAREIPRGCRYRAFCLMPQIPSCATEAPYLESSPGDVHHRVACPVVLGRNP